jgi:hypothetical protein
MSSYSISMGICIRKHPCLKHFIRRKTDLQDRRKYVKTVGIEFIY